jgi:hypothetical protein
MPSGDQAGTRLNVDREHHKFQLLEHTRRIGIANRQESPLSALQMVLSVEHSKTIDLPNVLRAVN